MWRGRTHSAPSPGGHQHRGSPGRRDQRDLGKSRRRLRLIDSGSAGNENGSAGDETASAGAWSIMSAIAERDFAQAVRTDRVQAEIKDTSAAVEVVRKTQAELDGKASAMWSVKMQVNANGQFVTAGIGLGIETDANGVTQSQFLVSADRFAVVGALAGGQVFTPFVVHNGQVFMASAFIQDGTITNAKIGEYISSINYVPGVSGWRLDKAGGLEINGVVEGGGRLTINNQLVSVYTPGGALKLRLGIW